MQAIQVSVLLLLLFFTIAGAILLYQGLRALLELGRDLFTELRGGGTPEEPVVEGPFSLRRPDSVLRQRHFRRHQVQVQTRWKCEGRWTSGE